MAPITLPPPRENSVSRTNVYLRRGQKAQAKRLARQRYDLSLSAMVREFLDRESKTKNGLLRAKLSKR